MPDSHDTGSRRGPSGRDLGLISLGGMIGAAARYQAGVLWPTAAGGFPWTTATINLIGSALLGALLAALDRRPAWRPARPFLGTGVIGGFTTFSTFAVDNARLLQDGRLALAAAYVLGTLFLCAAATVAGDAAVRALAR